MKSLETAQNKIQISQKVKQNEKNEEIVSLSHFFLSLQIELQTDREATVAL
jgi:hypothetical protein